MPRLTGIHGRKHAPLWDTFVHPDLPCDAWFTTQHAPEVPSELLFVTTTDLVNGHGGRMERNAGVIELWMAAPHQYPRIRALEAKHSADVTGWSDVVLDGWLEMIQ